MQPVATVIRILVKKEFIGFETFGKTNQYFYRGSDIAAPLGTNIYAVRDGVICLLNVDNESVHGKYIVIRHRNGYASRYTHMSELSVKLMAKVKKGDLIGKVGNTGQSTSPHLHLEIKKDGENVDPADLVDFSSLKRKL